MKKKIAKKTREIEGKFAKMKSDCAFSSLERRSCIVDRVIHIIHCRTLNAGHKCFTQFPRQCVCVFTFGEMNMVAVQMEKADSMRSLFNGLSRRSWSKKNRFFYTSRSTFYVRHFRDHLSEINETSSYHSFQLTFFLRFFVSLRNSSYFAWMFTISFTVPVSAFQSITNHSPLISSTSL